MYFLMKCFTLLIQSVPVIIVLLIMKYYLDKRKMFILGSRLPGPKPLPFIGNALDFVGKNLDPWDKIVELNKKYDFVAHWTGHHLRVFICAPQYAEVYFTSRHLCNKGVDYRFLKTLLGEGLITANGNKWQKARKWIEPSFSYSNLQNFIDIYQEKGEILIQRLEKEEGKSVFSIFPYVKSCAFDIICEVTVPLGVNAQDEVIESLEQVDAVLAGVCDRGYNLWHYPDFIYKCSTAGKHHFRKIDQVKKFFRSHIKRRKEISMTIKKGNNNEDKIVLLDRLLENQEWNEEVIIDQVLTLIGAAYESSAITICFVLMMLGIHKDIQERLFNELSIAYENGLQDKDLQRVEYLDMVIKETMRLFAIIPYVIREASEDVQMGKHLIPKGASVVLNLFALHRHPDVYEHPNAFNPDNFLPENIKKRHQYSFLPFVTGIRKCLGHRVAMMTVRTLVSKILCNYKIECDLKIEDITVRDRITLRTKNGLYPIRIFKR